ncbi:MAG TPA: Fe-S cluster assembly ATPase SufC [Thermoanaerobaculia bacterium]|nr:Fe-S cluster assembly ATPase SufC [Thermoanaerobaculia bacterium]HUM28822.1 Fe-S cluster assembly ATPase SufC [Thermoanaerobaculia bacterium]HXK69079.1 Fe-S cluster assembly ATPase SufC [Thermoanaerobaculia bacterium]
MIQLLSLSGVKAGIEGKSILKGVDLELPPGEVHAIMGPNGSGKSTLANVIMGNPAYEFEGGDILFHGSSILELSTDERARLGLFLSFQHPVSLPGISLLSLIKKSTGCVLGPDAYPTSKSLFQNIHALRDLAAIPADMISRETNEGFSGGEKKKAEILQLGMLRPRVVILDEIDSGLDIDALKSVSTVVNSLRDDARSFLIITHYQRILSLIRPDRVHIMKEGRIVRSGGEDLVETLEQGGYAEIEAAS